jgi:hypothetical protein
MPTSAPNARSAWAFHRRLSRPAPGDAPANALGPPRRVTTPNGIVWGKVDESLISIKEAEVFSTGENPPVSLALASSDRGRRGMASNPCAGVSRCFLLNTF